VISGQLLWSNEGADCSLVESPANVNDCWPELEELRPAALDELLPELDGRRSMKGTATNLPPLELEDSEVSLEVGEVELGEVVFALELGDVVFALALELLLPLELVEITAKSMRPEDGFTTMSFMVPRLWPWLLLTSALMILLALVSCCPIRPAQCLLELSELRPDWPDWLDCPLD